MAAQPLRLDPDDIAFFKENGYIELKGVFSEDDGRAFALTMLHLVAAQNCPGLALPDYIGLPLTQLRPLLLDGLMRLEQTNHDYIRNIYDTARDTPALRGMTGHAKVCAAVSQLMGLPEHAPLYMKQCACRIDPPYDKAFTLDWHQEVHYTYKDSQLLQMWAPALTDIRHEDGALQLLPGSHSVGVARTRDHIPEFGHAQFTVVPEVVGRFTPHEVTVPFGNALILNSTTIHKSGTNSTKRPRLTLLAHYHNALKPGFFANVRSEGTVQNAYA